MVHLKTAGKNALDVKMKENAGVADTGHVRGIPCICYTHKEGEQAAPKNRKTTGDNEFVAANKYCMGNTGPPVPKITFLLGSEAPGSPKTGDCNNLLQCTSV